MAEDDVDNYFMLLEGFGEEAEEEQEKEPDVQEAEDAPADGQEAVEAAEEELGWAVDTSADSRDVAPDMGDTDFEDYAADLAAQAALQMEAEVDAAAEEALAAEASLAREAADAAAAFGVEDEIPDFGMGDFVPENGTSIAMFGEAELEGEGAEEEVEDAGEEATGELQETGAEEAAAGEEEMEVAEAAGEEEEVERAEDASDGAAVSLQPSRKRSRDAVVAEAQELLATVTPVALLGKLRRLDPATGTEEYYMVDGDLEAAALAEDFQLTRDFYSAQALDNSLMAMRSAVQRVQSRVKKFADNHSITEVLPGSILLGDAAAARDLAAIQRLQIKKVINCSPQTVRDTGTAFYGPGVEYLELWQDDMQDYCIMHDFDVAWSFAFSGNTGGAVLVHCEMGVNRSCALAIALRMRVQRETEQLSDPEVLLKMAWCHVASRKQRVLQNTSFQRQLLLFARMGCCWFPTLDGVWRTVPERHMAQFRSLAEDSAKHIVCGNPEFPHGSWWRAIVYIRDGTMRSEQKMDGAFDLGTEAKRLKAEAHVRSYATNAMPKLIAAART